MESIKVYNSSLAEINNIETRMSYDLLTINFFKLDGISKEDIIITLSNVLARRKQTVIDTSQINKIEKKMFFDVLTIELNSLDEGTREDIIRSLTKVLEKRKQAIIDTLQGAH